MFEIELEILTEGFDYLVGIDEVGRGPLAGPVVSGAVAINTNSFLDIVKDFKSKIADSKKLTPLARNRAYKEIRKKLKLGIGLCSHETIDNINILEATKLSMQRAIKCLQMSFSEISKENTFIFFDGNMDINTPFLFKRVIDGDNKCFSISCASIIAKIIRDEIMVAYDNIYPGYEFYKNKGYGTKKHISAIAEYGVTNIHRKSFSPCSKYLC